ncbi:MAG TPA: MmcQ/YjbR family DNA-binding protein [Thermoanaerobaculia bacterium]|nr:MmcQ/YjbR family DNA-binding protein [Thermoanaerobaculia bacterium]
MTTVRSPDKALCPVCFGEYPSTLLRKGPLYRSCPDCSSEAMEIEVVSKAAFLEKTTLAELTDLRDRWKNEKGFLPEYHARKLRRLDAIVRAKKALARRARPSTPVNAAEKKKRSQPAPTRRTTFAVVRRLALSLPGTVEAPCYGTPGFRVAGRLFARLREDGESLVLGVDLDSREALLESRPDVFYITDHYRGYKWVLARFGLVRPAELKELLAEAWRRVAPKRLVSSS